VTACGREELLNKQNEYLHNNYRIYQIHFENNQFLNDLKNRLHTHACPKEHKDNESESHTSNEIQFAVLIPSDTIFPNEGNVLLYVLQKFNYVLDN